MTGDLVFEWLPLLLYCRKSCRIAFWVANANWGRHWFFVWWPGMFLKTWRGRRAGQGLRGGMIWNGAVVSSLVRTLPAIPSCSLKGALILAEGGQWLFLLPSSCLHWLSDLCFICVLKTHVYKGLFTEVRNSCRDQIYCISALDLSQERPRIDVLHFWWKALLTRFPLT